MRKPLRHDFNEADYNEETPEAVLQWGMGSKSASSNKQTSMFSCSQTKELQGSMYTRRPTPQGHFPLHNICLAKTTIILAITVVKVVSLLAVHLLKY